MLGLYTPSRGTILFDGHDVRQLDLPTLRRQIGLVPQEVHLFNGTLRANIALADPESPLSRVREAAELAGISEAIERLPMQYDTPISEGVTFLSGGQRQRVALARALLTRPPVLILDEATNGMDGATERRIQDNLLRLGCTRIIISHRMTSVREADRIVVLDEGRLVAQGEHDTLLANHDLYSRLVSSQLRPDPEPQRRRPVQGAAG